MGNGSQLILIDGYNVIRRSEPLARAERRSLQNGRDALLTMLAARYSRGVHTIIVVFDGAGTAETREARFGMTVIFTPHNVTADTCIIQLAQVAQSHGQRVTVATDDNEIRHALHHLMPAVQPQTANDMSKYLHGAPRLIEKQYKHRTTVRRILAKDDDDDSDTSTPRQQNKCGNPRRQPKRRP